MCVFAYISAIKGWIGTCMSAIYVCVCVFVCTHMSAMGRGRWGMGCLHERVLEADTYVSVEWIVLVIIHSRHGDDGFTEGSTLQVFSIVWITNEARIVHVAHNVDVHQGGSSLEQW